MTFLPGINGDGQKLTVYQRQKNSGIRRSNGALKLKKLSTRHLAIASMHLEGRSGETIAKSINCTVVTVSRVLNDPLVKQLVSRIFSDRQMELDALAGKAIDVVRESLDKEGNTTRERLTAVDKFTKLRDSIGVEVEASESAEDIVSRIFSGAAIKDSNIQVNIGSRDD